MEKEQIDREKEEKLLGKLETEVQDRAQVTQWCRCVNFKPTPTDPKSHCCHEWDFVRTQLEDLCETQDVSASRTVCITNPPGIPALLNADVTGKGTSYWSHIQRTVKVKFDLYI